jgi:hypothetical protein
VALMGSAIRGVAQNDFNRLPRFMRLRPHAPVTDKSETIGEELE